MKKLSTGEFRQIARNGGDPPSGIVMRDSSLAPQVIGGSSRSVAFIFSDESVDRSGDVIKANGWQLDKFSQNSVALWAHQADQPPIGRASSVRVSNRKLLGNIEFAGADIYPMADQVFRLVKGGFLKAVSVGFRPIKWKFSSDPARPLGIDFLEQELLEISVCPVPANSNALIEARAAGISTGEVLRTLERQRHNRIAEAKTIAQSARRMTRT
jgi:HK97 family phage prohead protease